MTKQVWTGNGFADMPPLIQAWANVGVGGGTEIECAPFPSFPGDGCTGWQHTGTILEPYHGGYFIDTPGAVIVGKDIDGGCGIAAPDITFINCRIHAESASPTTGGGMGVVMVPAYGAANLTLVDCEICRLEDETGGLDYCLETNGCTGLTMLRCNLHNVTSGIHLSGAQDVSIEDCFIHDLVNISGEDHCDGIISNGGATNVRLAHNNIENPNPQTSPLAIFPEEPNVDWLVTMNQFNGGGYGMYPKWTPGSDPGPNTGLRVISNYFGRKFFPNCGSFGVVAPATGGFFDGAGNVWSGNVWADTGEMVPIT